jgi:hypothetical protein
MMTILDSALRAAEALGLRDRTYYERARAGYNDLAERSYNLRDYMPNRSSLDASSLTMGLILGAAVGVGIGIYLADSVKPAIRSARKQVREAAETVQGQIEQLPTRLNITRMEEQTAKQPQQ